MSLREVNRLSCILAVIGVGLLFIARFAGRYLPFVLGVLVLVGGLVLVKKKLCCPHCGGFIRDTRAEFCAFCGEPIDWDEK